MKASTLSGCCFPEALRYASEKETKRYRSIVHCSFVSMLWIQQKDKASVLDNTRNYLNTLRTQISELDERNRLLEVQLRHQRENEEDGDPNETVQIRITGSSELEERNRLPEVQLRHQGEEEEDGDPNEIVQVRVTWSSESTSETQRINIGVTVRVECNAIDMILNVLERLKRMRGATLVSVETSTRSSQTNVCMKASLTLQVKVRTVRLL